MNAKFVLLVLLTLLSVNSGWSQFVYLRISVKVVTHPTFGRRPENITNEMFYIAEDRANAWMANYYRGYRFRIIEVVDIGGPFQGGTNGPSKWFGTDPTENWAAFQNEVQNDPRFLFRPDAVNFHITFGPGSNTGGACPIPGNPNDAGFLACWGIVNDGAFWIGHETGHFFGLGHTFGGCECSAGCNYPSTDDDGIADTLPEGDCWTRAQIATRWPTATAEQVDNTFFNVMAYHNVATKDVVQNRMTELQLDRHADIASTPAAAGGRGFASSGRTHFISGTGSDGGSGRSTSPLRTVGRGVTNSLAGDMLLLRPGNYNQQFTINRPVTLRAARTGWATIGRP